MEWNWQNPDWPLMRTKRQLWRYRKSSSFSAPASSSVPASISTPQDKDRLRIKVARDEAVKTSEIEGEFLDRDSPFNPPCCINLA